MSTKIKDKQIEVSADYSASAEPTESGIKTKDLRGFAAWVAKSVRWLKNNYLPLSGGTMTGRLKLANEYETGVKKVYSRKGVVGILKPYSEWTAEEKSGKFRCIKIVLPVTYYFNSTPWFRYNVRVSFNSTYTSYNSFGHYEFGYNIAVNVTDTTVPRMYAYKNNRTVIAAASDEFIPLEPVYNTATGNLELWIISKVPRSNNVAMLLQMEDYNKNPANAILPTQMELVDNDGYFPVSSPLVKVPFDLVNMETTTGDYSPLSHHSVNFNSAIEPTQAGDTVKKSLGWLLQYYAQATKWARNNILSLVSGKADINHTHSEYLTEHQSLAGLVPDKQLTNEDLNEVVDTGFYHATASNTCANRPFSDNTGFGLQVVRNSYYSNWLTQIYYYQAGGLYIRNRNNSTWRDWQKMEFTDTKYSAGAGVAIDGNNKVSVRFGNTAGTACEGDDARLSDARTPLAHTHAEYSLVGHNHDTQYAARYHAHPDMMAGIECVNGTVHTDGGEKIYYSTDNSNVIMSKEAADKFSLYAYPYWSDIKGKPDAFPPSSHTHNYAQLNHSHSWGDIQGKPTTYPPSSHTHNYAAISHSHAWLNITGVQVDTGSFNILERPTENIWFNWKKKDGGVVSQGQSIRMVHINNGTGTANYATVKARSFVDERKGFGTHAVSYGFDVLAFPEKFLQYRCLELVVDVYNGQSYGGVRPPLDVGEHYGKIYMVDSGFPVDIERETVVYLKILNGNVSGQLSIGGLTNHDTIFYGDSVFPFNTLNGNYKPIGFFVMKVIGGKKFMRGYRTTE